MAAAVPRSWRSRSWPMLIGDDLMAMRLHQAFKWRVIAHLERNEGWSMNANSVRIVAHRLARERWRQAR